MVIVWQLAGAWACGSLLPGTVALVFLGAHAAGRTPGPPVPVEPATVSLALLTPLERLAVFALIAALFVALGVLSWRTAPASWLSDDSRTRLLWALLVGAGGLAGWGFAGQRCRGCAVGGTGGCRLPDGRRAPRAEPLPAHRVHPVCRLRGPCFDRVPSLIWWNVRARFFVLSSPHAVQPGHRRLPARRAMAAEGTPAAVGSAPDAGRHQRGGPSRRAGPAAAKAAGPAACRARAAVLGAAD